jgi:exodeoxyribonuclease VII small subunit
MVSADANADVPSLSYEAARDELIDIVARLENGRAGLEESMALWQRGEALAAHCTGYLDTAQAALAGNSSGGDVAAAPDAGADDEE